MKILDLIINDTVLFLLTLALVSIIMVVIGLVLANTHRDDPEQDG